VRDGLVELGAVPADRVVTLLDPDPAFDRDAAGGRLVVVGAGDDPAGVPAVELLAQPALVAVPLR
jgi:hypothetical protein